MLVRLQNDVLDGVFWITGWVLDNFKELLDGYWIDLNVQLDGYSIELNALLDPPIL